MPRPQVLTVTLVTALTLLLPALVHVRSQAASGPAGATTGEHAHAGHVHPGVVPVAAVTPPVLSRTGWTVTADSQEVAAENGAATNAIDGNPNTFWHTKWSGGAAAPLPHTLTIDVKAATTVGGLKYLGRANPNGRIGQYRVEVSTDATTWTVAATGTFADTGAEKTVSFAGTTARYVRLVALTEAGNRGPWSNAAEINLLGAAPTTTTPTTTTPPTTTIPPATPTTTVAPSTSTAPATPGPLPPRTGWTVTADSQEVAAENGAATNAIDGNPNTYWHTKWSGGAAAPLPHTLTIDLKTSATVGGLKYLARAGNANGRIGQYRVEVSTDATTWTVAATGAYADTAVEKTVSFADTTARYVRLVALTEAGNRGPWSTAAEVNLLGATTTTTTTATPPPPTTTVPPTTTPPATPGPLPPRTGWTASADSQEVAAENGAATNAVDGNAATYWHTKWSGTADPLPHTLTIDMKATGTVGGLKYLARAGNVNGRIGQYRVETSIDATTWTAVATGTFGDDATEKTATFAATTARYVRLVALTEAGRRGPWSNAAEVNLLGPATTTTGSSGKWDAPTGFPLVPAAAAMLPNGKVLTWSAYAKDNWGGANGVTQTATLDPATGTVSQATVSNTGHDMFCPGTAMLADGRVLVNGGSNSNKTSIFDPSGGAWSASSPLATPRGYQSAVTLSDGQVFTLGGSWSGGTGGKNGEIWSPTTGSRALPGALVAPAMTADGAGAYRADNHMWLFAWGDGRVFQAGPSKAMNWYGTSGSGNTLAAGTRGDDTDAMNGNAVMYEPGRILTVGGAPSYQNVNAKSSAYVVDITGAAVSVRKLPSMANSRAFANSVVLPDGKVVVVGGQNFPVPFSDNTAVLTPEMWDPATGQFTSMAPMAIPRTYHSVALLLPDGRVLSGGGGLCGSCQTNHFDAQIFTPPYLLNPDGTPRSRPTITDAPGAATAGSTMSVTTDRGVTAFSLVRMSSVTHTVDTDQRRIPLTVTGTAGPTTTVGLPADRGVLVPGYYMLFALDAAGVPSVSKIVRIS